MKEIKMNMKKGSKKKKITKKPSNEETVMVGSKGTSGVKDKQFGTH